jgi:hypothetical protein
MGDWTDKLPPRVRLTWLKSNVLLQNCVDSCTISGTEAEDRSITGDLTECQEATITFKESSLKTQKYSEAEVVAKQQIDVLKALDDWWNKKTFAFLKANAGAVSTNGLLADWTWNATDKRFDIASPNYTLKLAARMQLMRELNNISSGYLIDNGELYLAAADAILDSGNSNGSGDNRRVDALGLNYDIQGFSSAALTESLFHVTPGSFAFVGANRYTSTMQVIGGGVQQTRYTVASPSIPNLFYDVIYKMECSGLNDIVHSWKFMTHGGFVLAPTGDKFPQGGTIKDTGIVAFNKL